MREGKVRKQGGRRYKKRRTREVKLHERTGKKGKTQGKDKYWTRN